MTNVRGSRPEPGLKPQHLTAVELLATVCDAGIEGASLDAEEVVFRPGSPRAGQFEAAVGTAGSLTLVFDTLLPLAVALDRPLAVSATGGTAVKWSPPLSTYRGVKLPLCRRFGLSAAVDRHLADQLLVVLALAGGQVRIPAMTAHVETSLALLDAFGFDPTVDTSGGSPVISIKRSAV